LNAFIAAVAITGFSIAALIVGFAMRTVLTMFALLDTEYSHEESEIANGKE